MSARLRHYFASLPLGITSLCLLLAAGLAWTVYPGPPGDVVRPEWLSAVQLSLDRLQVRLSGDTVRDAALQRSPDSQAYRAVARHVDAAVGQFPSPPDVVRLWTPEQFFTQDTSPLVERLVLLYEHVAAEPIAPAEPVGLGSRIPVRSNLLGATWYTSETTAITLPESHSRAWLVRATTPLIDKSGHIAGLLEVRLALARPAAAPQWPRAAIVVALGLALVVFWELREAPLRRVLRAVNVPVSLATVTRVDPADPNEERARARIDYLATQAGHDDRLWPVRPAPAPSALDGFGHAVASVRRRTAAAHSGTPAAMPADSVAEHGDVAGPPSEPRTLAAATIEDENLLRRLLDILLPRLSDGEAPAAAPGVSGADLADSLARNLSLRVTIEVRSRSAEAPPAEPSRPAERDRSQQEP